MEGVVLNLLELSFDSVVLFVEVSFLRQQQLDLKGYSVVSRSGLYVLTLHGRQLP